MPENTFLLVGPVHPEPEMCFRSAETRKDLNFLRWIHVSGLVLKFWSDLSEWNGIQFVFLNHRFDEYSCSVKCNNFFISVLFWVAVFSYCPFTALFVIGFQNWFDHEWKNVRVFGLKYGNSADFIFHLCFDWHYKKCSIACLFWLRQIASINSWRCILFCSLKAHVLFIQ